MEKPYDSAPETLQHIGNVRKFLKEVNDKLTERGIKHDRSKLIPPEKELFDVWTPKLKEMEYGSQEYKDSLINLKPALDNHYEKNSHHPEHYPNGIADMDLLDIIEMLADWKASTLRTKNGDLRKSIDIASERFGISEQLKLLLINTGERMEWFNG